MESKWTKERCQEEALKYKNRSEYHSKSNRSYRIACKNKWIDDICSHMKIENFKYRCVYAYEFPDKNVYIGLTYLLENRNYRHSTDKRSSVNKHIIKTGLNPKLIQLTDYILLDASKEMEKFYVEKYKNEGWNILNKAKTGSAGGITLIWTKEKCIEAASKCETRSEFWEKYTGAVNSCKRNGWITEIHNIIKCQTKEKGHWNNYDNCLKEALKYKSKIDFNRKSPGAMDSAKLNGWYEDICSHMIRPKPKNFKWTKEKCQEEALKYENKFDFQKNSPSSYNKSIKMKWIDEICNHMKIPSSYNFKWTKEKCQEEALKYNRRIDFFKGSPGVYGKCQKQKWLDDVCSHMKPKKLRNYWTKDKCIEEITKYKTKTEFARKSPTAYQLCLKNKWTK